MKRYFRRTKESHILVPAPCTMQGFWRLTAIRPDGRRRPLTGWFPNLITDGGLNRRGTGNWMNHCHVGSGTTPAEVTDSALETFVASTSTLQNNSGAAQSTAPYYGSQTNTYRFATGAAAGNLSEVGVGWSGDSSGPLFSRALILDGDGDPTTVTVLSDEVLDAVYQLRLYPPLDDVNDFVDDDGPDETTHAIVTRASLVTGSGNSGINRGWGMSSSGSSVLLSDGTGSRARVFNGALGSITEAPSGTSAEPQVGNVSSESYSNNSLERAGSQFYGLNNGNLSGGISAVQFAFRNNGCYQTSFDPAIPKDNTKILTLTFKTTWARHDP